MDITARAKDELDKRVYRIENFIENRGLGSDKLNKAKRIQRNVNLAVVLGGIITIAGITVWALTNSDNE